MSIVTFQSRGQYIRQIYLWSLVQFPVNALFSSKIGKNPKKRLKTAVGQICTAVVKTVETVGLKPQNRRFGTPYRQYNLAYQHNYFIIHRLTTKSLNFLDITL
ncbi:Hypothetical_protein [Hexamita inflata]|uniref:Hypothetical_protein n=1 Tax=Hexamita inflata TaxID=28002 RepID=A0ABP1IZH4_9EUKA